MGRFLGVNALAAVGATGTDVYKRQVYGDAEAELKPLGMVVLKAEKEISFV